jgi:hypothetical protein
MSAIVDLKTLRDASRSAITLTRLIRNCLRAIYEEAMVLCLTHTSRQPYIEAPRYMAAICL